LPRQAKFLMNPLMQPFRRAEGSLWLQSVD